MTALDTIDKILDSELYKANLKYCFVDEDKKPHKVDDTLARPNCQEDFVDFDILLQHQSFDYAGVGISVQASKVFAIDVDHCFSSPFILESGDDRAKNILELLKNFAYCEFSFSGTGLRALFKMPIIQDYIQSYYIKNSNNGIEFYQPNSSFRYVTVTGVYIYNNPIVEIGEHQKEIFTFLNQYMKKPERRKIQILEQETRSFEQLMNLTKYLYLTNPNFQNLWFGHAPGSGKDESEKDFQILALLFENITTDKEKLRQIFESSPYFKSKDHKHLNKWEYNDHRYFEYIFKNISQ